MTKWEDEETRGLEEGGDALAKVYGVRVEEGKCAALICNEMKH